MIRQKDQIRASRNLDEDYAPSGGFEGSAVGNLEDDLNAIRTQIRKILGGGNDVSPLEDANIHWYTEPVSSLFSLSLNNKNVWFQIKTSEGQTSPSTSFDTLTFDDGFGISISVADKTVSITNVQNQFTSFDAGVGGIDLQETPLSQPLEFVGNREIKTTFVNNSGTPEIYINYDGDLFFERRLWYNIKTYPDTNTITPSEAQDTLNFIGENLMKADTQSGDILYLEHEYDFSEDGTIRVGGLYLSNLLDGEILYVGENNYVAGDIDNLSWDDTEDRVSIRGGFSVNNGNVRVGQAKARASAPLERIIGSWDSLTNPTCVVVCKNFVLVGQDNEGGVSLHILSAEIEENISSIGTYTSTRTQTGGVIELASDGAYVYLLFENPFVMEVIDISDPQNPTCVRSVGISESEVNLASIEISGRCLYVSSELGTFYCYNVSSPENPVLDNSINIGKSINGMSIFANRAYLATSFIGADLMEIVDLDTFTFYGSYSDGNEDDTEYMYDIYSTGTFVYVIYRNSDRLEVINVLDPDNPEVLDRIVGLSNFTGSETLAQPLSIKVLGTYAYIICAGRNGSFPRLVVMDLVNPIFPSVASVIGDGTHNRFDGISDFDISGKYAYIVGKDSGSLSIVDLSSVHFPTGIIPEIFANHTTCERIDISGNLNVEGGLGIGAGGLWMTDTEANIFTNSNLHVGSGLGVGFNTIPNYEFEVRGGKFKQKIKSATSASSSGRGYIGQDILTDIAVVGDIAYILNYGFTAIDIYNIKNPKNITYIVGLGIGDDYTADIQAKGGFELNPKGYAYGYAYGYDFSNSLDYWDVLKQKAPSDNSGLTKMEAYGQYLFITAAVTGYLIVMDISEPYSPTYVTSVFVDQPDPEVGYGANGMYISGNRIYVTSGTVYAAAATGSLSIFDITDPTAPNRIGYYIPPEGDQVLDGSSDIVVSGRYAYTACASGSSVSVFDVSDPQNISHVYSYYFEDDTGDIANSIALKGKYLYVACEEGFEGDEPDDTNTKGALHVLDVSDVTNITKVDSVYNVDGELAGATKVKVVGENLLVLSRFSAILSVYDVSDPENPSLAAQLSAASISDFGTTIFEMIGNHALVCSYDISADDNFVFTLPYAGAESNIAEFGSVLTSDVMVKNNMTMMNKALFEDGIICHDLFVRDSLHAEDGYSGQVYATRKSNGSYTEVSVGDDDELTWGRLQPEVYFTSSYSNEDIISFDRGKVIVNDDGFYRITWNLLITADTTQDVELRPYGYSLDFQPRPMVFHLVKSEAELVKLEYIGRIRKYDTLGDEVSVKLKVSTSGTEITWGRDSRVTVERL